MTWPLLTRLAALALCCAAARGSAEAGEIRLATRSIDTERSRAFQPADFARAGDAVLLHLAGPPQPAELEQVRRAGATLLGFIPPDALLLRADSAARSRLRGLPEARWLGPLDPGDKLSPDLSAELLAARGGELIIELFSDSPAEPAARRLAERGLRVDQIQATPQIARLRGRVRSLAQAAALAADPAVQWIEPAPRFTLRNDQTTGILQSNIDGIPSIWNRGLRGEGEVIGHIDGRIDSGGCYFADPLHPLPGPEHRKLVGDRNNAGEIIDSHGTHTAGIAAGLRFDGMPNEAGMAPNAKLSHSSLFLIEDDNLYDYLALARADGAAVHSNSWGDDGTTAYTSWARDIDRFSYDFEDQVVLFAVTNQATLRTPENAKNVLAVAATREAPAHDSFCLGGRGPTADGRRKPEILAPGCAASGFGGVQSAAAFQACGLTRIRGTSMACPAIAGGATLARQYFRSGWAPSGLPFAEDAVIPSGALLRATVLNAGADLFSVPDFPGDQEGWGRLFLDSTLAFYGEPRGIRTWDLRNPNGIGGGESRSYPLVIDSSSEPLKVTLAFTDPPGTPNAASPVINNLDLTVAGPSGTFRGNQFAGGVSVPGGSPDPLNTVELVLLAAPAPGQYMLTVNGTSVPAGPQGFALVASGDFASLPATLAPESIGTQPFTLILRVTLPDGFSSLERFRISYNGSSITQLFLDYLGANPGALQTDGNSATVTIPGLSLPSGNHTIAFEIGDQSGRIGVARQSYSIP